MSGALLRAGSTLIAAVLRLGARRPTAGCLQDVPGPAAWRADQLSGDTVTPCLAANHTEYKLSDEGHLAAALRLAVERSGAQALPPTARAAVQANFPSLSAQGPWRCAPGCFLLPCSQGPSNDLFPEGCKYAWEEQACGEWLPRPGLPCP